MVSVIIPTYNYARFLPQTLNSLLTQSFADFECLIIDNGSTDNTTEVVREFLKDQRFIYTKQENLGVSAARNTGLSIAKGDFILFLDADDLIEKDKLKESVAYLNTHSECDLVYSDMRYFISENPSELFYRFACDKAADIPWMTKVEGRGSKLAAALLEGNIMVISSPVFKSSVIADIGKFDERIQYNEDWDLWLRFALMNKTMNYIDIENTRALVRIHKTSASVNIFKMQVCGLFVLLKNSELSNSFGLEKSIKRRIIEHKKAIYKLLFKMKSDDFQSALNFIEKLQMQSNIFPESIKNFTFAKLYLGLKIIVGI